MNIYVPPAEICIPAEGCPIGVPVAAGGCYAGTDPDQEHIGMTGHPV